MSLSRPPVRRHACRHIVRAGFAVALAIRPAASATTTTPPKGASGSTAAKKPAAAGVNAATVNGVGIPAAQVDREIKRVLASRPQPGASAEDTDALRKELVDRLIATELIFQQARQDKETVTDAEIEAEMAKLRERFASAKEFEAGMAAEGLTLEQMREQVRRELMVRRWLDKRVESGMAGITEGDLKTYYDTHPGEFQRGESVRLRHILIKTPPDASAEFRAAARKRAEAALARIRKGEDFAAVAKEVSEDASSAPKGGDLGPVARGETPEPFDTAAFALSKGATSEVVETQFGYHVIQAAEKIPAGLRPLDEVKERLREFLAMKERHDKLQTVVEDLRKKAKVEVF